jgi:hypothetical protein
MLYRRGVEESKGSFLIAEVRGSIPLCSTNLINALRQGRPCRFRFRCQAAAKACAALRAGVTQLLN